MVDGHINWDVSVPERDLLIQAQHLGEWTAALAAASDEIQRPCGTL
jgi:hypothetical protein